MTTIISDPNLNIVLDKHLYSSWEIWYHPELDLLGDIMYTSKLIYMFTPSDISGFFYASEFKNIFHLKALGWEYIGDL